MHLVYTAVGIIGLTVVGRWVMDWIGAPKSDAAAMVQPQPMPSAEIQPVFSSRVARFVAMTAGALVGARAGLSFGMWVYETVAPEPPPDVWVPDLSVFLYLLGGVGLGLVIGGYVGGSLHGLVSGTRRTESR